MCDMASPELELDRTALEKELTLAKLEADFYRANSATRKESIELDNIRNCLLQELVEIEENKNVELRKDIHEIQFESEKDQDEMVSLKKELEVVREQSQRDVGRRSLKEELKIAREKDQREITRLKDELKTMNVMYTLSEPTPVRSAKRNAITVLQESTVKRPVRNPPPLNNVGPGRGKAALKETRRQVAARSQSASGTASRGVRGRVAKSNHLSTDGVGSSSHVVEDGEDHKSTVAVRSRNSRSTKDDGLTSPNASVEILGISGAAPEVSPKKVLSLRVEIPLSTLVHVPTLPTHAEIGAAVKPGASGAGFPKQSGAAHTQPRLFPSGKRIGKPLDKPRSETDHVTPRLFPSGKRMGQPPKEKNVAINLDRNAKGMPWSLVSSRVQPTPRRPRVAGKEVMSKLDTSSRRNHVERRIANPTPKLDIMALEMPPKSSESAVVPNKMSPPCPKSRKSSRKKKNRLPKSKCPTRTDGKDSTTEDSDGTAMQGADQRIPKPIGSYYMISKPSGSNGTIVKRFDLEDICSMAVDRGRPGTDAGDIPEADDLTPPAKKKRVVLHDAQESKEPKKGRPITERSKAKKVDVASGEAVVAQKQPKRTHQEPEDTQSVPVTSSKDSAVPSEDTGEIDKAESRLAESPETSVSTSGSSLAGVGTENASSAQATSPSVLGKRGADHSSRRHSQADPCAPGLYERGDTREDSPEIPLQNLDATTPKKQPPCKVKKRKTLESVLTTLLESKIEGEVSPDGGSEDKSMETGQMETGQREVGPSGAAGHPKKDRSQEKTGQTLVGMWTRGNFKAEAFKLSVVDEESYDEKRSAIRILNTWCEPSLCESANPPQSLIPSTGNKLDAHVPIKLGPL